MNHEGSTASGVRMALKRATSSLHEKVDAQMPLSRECPALDDYRRHLQLLRHWVDDLGTLGVDRDRLQAEARAIDADLAQCSRLQGGRAPASPQGAKAVRLPSAPSRAKGWGAQYVLEGSRLGATFLHRRLAAVLAPHPLAYLSGAGWMREGAWRDFLLDLERQVRAPSELAAAVDGAREAFSMLLRRCEEQGSVPSCSCARTR